MVITPQQKQVLQKQRSDLHGTHLQLDTLISELDVCDHDDVQSSCPTCRLQLKLENCRRVLADARNYLDFALERAP